MMLTPQGVVKLMDFGIARSATDGSLTSTGTTLGSLNYMPPEQVRGEAADARSDIYSFGVSLYEMLTGKLPFQGDSQYSLMTAHLNQVPAAPISLRSDLPAGLSEIIMMAIAKDPANRFQSADAFRAALSSVQVSDLPASNTTLTPTPKPSGATTLVDTPHTPRIPTTPAPPRTPAPISAPRLTPAPPTAPLSSPPAPVAAAPPPPVAHSNSSRGVWLAIGAMLGVGVLIAAGMYIPRHFGTHADPNKSTVTSNANSTAGPDGASMDSSTANTTDASATPANPMVSIQSPQGGIKVDDQGNVAMEGPNGSIKVGGPNGGVRISGKHGESIAIAPGAQEPPPGPSPEEIAKMEDEADKLNVRAAAATESVETLRKQQMAAGYNLRADIASSLERMQIYTAKGNTALKAQDLKNAQKYFDMADVELTKIEKFLGH
jgi:eukaryotic-like serine/threonine-protein kinase